MAQDKELKASKRNDRLFQLFLTIVGAAATIYAAYATSVNIIIRQENAAIIGTATQERLDANNAPTATKLPSQTPYPTNTNLPTYTPYPTFTDVPTSTAIPTPDALFKDNFSDDSGGWILEPPLLLSNGKLTVSVEPNQKIWITIPNFKITSPNYLIQAEMQLNGDGNCYQGMGFALGEKDVSFHKFLLRNECDGFGFLHAFVGYSDNNKELFSTELKESKPDFRKPHTLKLESKNGLLTLSYDGISTVSQQITPYGQDIGFFVENNEGQGTRIYSFDNLIVKEIP